MDLTVVNSTKYGGSGGSWAVFAGGNSSAHEIALHELGHSFSHLADEYADLSGAYTGNEPSEPNATKSATGAKWSHWIGFDDPRGSNLDINVFQGAKRYPTGVYRPSLNSKMRTLGQPFDAVSRETFILDIYDFVKPLDGWLANSAPVTNGQFWVDAVDTVVQAVEWYVDGSLIAAATDEAFDTASLGLTPGDHTVRARVYDRVLDHVQDGGLLDLVRKDLSRLEQSVTWTLSIVAPLPGDFNADGAVDDLDLAAWSTHYGQSTASPAQGDGDADGDVDGDDFLIWQRGVGVGPAGNAQSIPEPGSLSLALLAVAYAARRRTNGA
jgi:hypothetical protein